MELIRPSRRVAVIGGGLAGISASIVLAEHGMQVTLIERHPRLGGRATSYVLPGGEHIDNCQHVTLRCCTNLADLYRRIGVSGNITYYDRLVFADSKGRRGEIRSSRLPAPLHLAPSFITFPLLTWKDKRAVARAMLRIIRMRGRLSVESKVSMLEWLQQNGQTPNAINRFWNVVLVSALNEQLERTDAAYGIAVFWKAFLANRTGFAMGIPAVPLEALYASVEDHIKRSNGFVRTRCGAVEFCLSNDKVTCLRLDDGVLLEADYYVAAVPFDRLMKMLPSAVQNCDFFSRLRNLRTSPITSVHLWFDRHVMSELFLTSVDQTIQWVFNRSLASLTDHGQQYLQIVISASHALSGRSQQEVIEMCRKELAELIPATGEARLVRAVVVRENAATFSPEPGCDRFRPDARTPIANLFLAGDWTQTGWPATMESAVRSGYRAAEWILAAEGHPVQVLQPELEPSGLTRWL